MDLLPHFIVQLICQQLRIINQGGTGGRSFKLQKFHVPISHQGQDSRSEGGAGGEEREKQREEKREQREDGGGDDGGQGEERLRGWQEDHFQPWALVRDSLK